MNLRFTLLSSILTTLVTSGCVTHAYREPSAEEKAKRAEVQRLFAAGCKRSGEAIHRTVKNVEGIMLLKLRPAHFSPYDKNAIDPYGYDFDWSNGDKPPPYITTFLVGKDERGYFQETNPIATKGYRYVEAINPKDGKRYRYTGSVKVVGRKDPTTYNHQI